MVRVLTWTLWNTKDDILKKLSTVFLTILKNAIKVVVLDPIDIFKMVNSLKSSSK